MYVYIHIAGVRPAGDGLLTPSLKRADDGTPDYMAPEVIRATGHGRSVDWFKTTMKCKPKLHNTYY